jgi:hypothetical protein
MVMVNIGYKNMKHLEVKIKEHEINGKNKNIIDCIGVLMNYRRVTGLELT